MTTESISDRAVTLKVGHRRGRIIESFRSSLKRMKLARRIFDRGLYVDRNRSLKLNQELFESAAHVDSAGHRPHLSRKKDFVNGPQHCLGRAYKDSKWRRQL